MSILNDAEQIRQQDPGEMGARIREFPQQLRDAWQNVSGWKVKKSLASKVDEILVLGMGGSAIGADLVAGVLAAELPVPLLVHRGYDLPGWVDKNTLVIASSHSGNTEETLSGWKMAAARQARGLAITTGGDLAAQAAEADAPLLRFAYDSQPRAALGHSFALLLGTLWKLGLLEDPSEKILAAADFLEEAQQEWVPEVALDHNWAKQLASWWQGHLPVIFGAEHLTVVARRWTGQINENAKQWALWAEMPELNHNLVVGFPHPPLVQQGARVICLRSEHYHERNSARFDITTRLLAQEHVQWGNIEAAGDDRLSELLWASLLGDYASYYLALLNGADPTPVEAIAHLKRKLAER